MLLTLILNLDMAAGTVFVPPVPVVPMLVGGWDKRFELRKKEVEPVVKRKNDDDEVLLIIKTFFRCQ